MHIKFDCQYRRQTLSKLLMNTDEMKIRKINEIKK